MVTAMTLYCHLMLNDQFLGERHQIEALQAQIEQQYSSSYTVRKTSYQDSNAAALSALESNFGSPETVHLVISSGSHGFQFITNDGVKDALQKKKPIVLWVGHQDPGLIKHKESIHIVALPKHITEGRPDLRSAFGERLIEMETVPNTLQIKDLMPALQKWNATYSQEAIAETPEGAIGVFLGGPAPKPDGAYLYEDLDTIRQRGLKFGELAKQRNQKLYIVNGPRTGRFYQESSDASDPVLRQFSVEHGWISFGKLTDEQRRITVSKLPDLPKEQREAVSKTIAHAHSSPLDPETAAFITGVEQSGLDKSQYRVFDFKATPGEPVKSAYLPVIAVLSQSKDKSMICYSGESISYAEMAYVIPATYAFKTLTMNEGHTKALERFQNLGMVGVLDFDKPLQPLDLKKKQEAVQGGSQQDAAKVAGALRPLLVPQLPRSSTPTLSSVSAQPPVHQGLSAWLPSRRVTYGLIAGGVAVAAGLFFLWRSSQKTPGVSDQPSQVPRIRLE